MTPDIAEHPVAEGDRIHADVEELRAEVADHCQVDAVLDLCEGIVAPRRNCRSCGSQSLVEFHQRLLALRRRRLRGSGAPSCVAELPWLVIKESVASSFSFFRPRRSGSPELVAAGVWPSRARNSSASERNAFAAAESGLPATIGCPSLTARGTSTSLGMRMSARLPITARTSSSSIPTRLSARLRTRTTRSGS